MDRTVSSRQSYRHLVRDISEAIRQSRYHAASRVNREMLLLYFTTGKLLSERISRTAWGDRTLQEISWGIQENFPGIRGFSISNLKNMRQFFEAYEHMQFGQLPTGQICKADKANDGDPAAELFLSIGFAQHVLLLQRCPDASERNFFI